MCCCVAVFSYTSKYKYMYGYTRGRGWGCVGFYVYVGVCMDMQGCIWINMIVYGYVRVSVDM